MDLSVHCQILGAGVGAAVGGVGLGVGVRGAGGCRQLALLAIVVSPSSR